MIAVRDLAFWQRQDVKETLSETLGFLSEDWWRFDFVANQHPIELQQYLGLKEFEADLSGGTSIVLFSGGLNSLAGAVHELLHTNRHVVLVSHRNLPIVGKRQKELAGKLAATHPRRVTHVWVDNHLRFELPDREPTQRTRSFFFAAMAAVAAHIEKSDRIRFYENGVMSVNLPIATQVVGARSSRSTHPRSLQLLNCVIHLVSRHPIEIDNPFIWMTKAQVIAGLVATQHASLITRSISCTRSRSIKTYRPHCGTCIQCVQRRFSTLAGGGAAFDESEGYESDVLTGSRDNGANRVMVLDSVSLALDCASISERDFMSRFAEPVAKVLQAYPAVERDDIARKVVDLFRRHGNSVRSVLARATEPYDVIDGVLPPSSLLALVLASRLTAASPVSIEPPPARLPEPPPGRTETANPSADIFIAVDEAQHRIHISDRPSLFGSAIFPILKLLIEMSLTQRTEGRLPQNHNALLAKTIADKLGTLHDEAVRSAIRRARKELEEAALALDDTPFDPNAIIETVRKGYRINPTVVLVSLEEFKRR